MKAVGIICEYNPFHKGHEYLINMAKESGDAVVAVMSGGYTQRGELAIADKYVRAEAAVKCGADLVLELPFPYSMASAEFFAAGGVSVLGGIGVDAVCFGSESGDIGLIKRAAEIAISEEFAREREKIAEAEGSASGYFGALGRLMGEDTSLLSNDILAVEYVKAIISRGLDIAPIAIKRIGDGFRDESVSSEIASATAIRGIIAEGGDFLRLLPDASYRTLADAVVRGEAPVDVKNIESAVLAFWRTAEPSTLSSIAELGGGLEYRIRDAALSSVTLSELEEKSATKKYTAAKIRRAILFAMIGVTMADLDRAPEYTSVLAANGKGREILAQVRSREGIRIVTKSADAPKCRQQELSARADALYTLAMPSARSAGYINTKKIYIKST